jgi:AhpC/TSA family protein
MKSGEWLAVLGLVIALGGIGAYAALLRVATIRNHPELYVLACAVGTALAIMALRRPHRWPAWVALAITVLLLLGTATFDFVLARVPGGPPSVRVGEQPPDFTLPDASGRPVSLAEFRGKKPVVVVFYRGHW